MARLPFQRTADRASLHTGTSRTMEGVSLHHKLEGENKSIHREASCLACYRWPSPCLPGFISGLRSRRTTCFGPWYANEELVVPLETDLSQIILFRNTCSAVLDAQLYPRLASTPYWVRLLYKMLGFSSRIQRYFVTRLLWI